MSWTVQRTRKTKRRLAKATTASPVETSLGPTLAKEIIAALFQHTPHRGVGASNTNQAAGRTLPRQPWMASRAPSTAAKDATLSFGATAAYAGSSAAPPVEAQPVEYRRLALVLAFGPELRLWQSALASKPRS